MNKRLGFLSLIGVAALLLATFGANALAAPSGVAGDVTFDRAWANGDPGQTIKITVSDDDENRASLEVEDEGLAGTAPYFVSASVPVTFFLARAPIADWAGIDQLVKDKDGDGEDDGKTSVEQIVDDLNIELGTSLTTATFFQAVGVSGASTTDQGRLDALNNARKGNGLDINDVMVVPADSAVQASVLGIASRSVTITSASGSGAFALVYFGSRPDTVDVKLKSTSDQTGYTQTLTENGLNTGVFTGEFTLGASTTEADQVLQAANGDVITVSYRDASEELTRTETLSVEQGAPEVSNLGPADGTYTNATTVVLTGDLVDAQSRVKANAITFYLSVDDGANFDAIRNEDDSENNNFSNDGYGLTEITGGLQASVRLSLDPPSGEDQVYQWYLEGGDNAGNVGASKADTDEADSGEDNAHSFTFDNQSVTLKTDDDEMNAILGQSYDAAEKEVVENVNTSIRVNFDGALDGDSVDASDFTVNGETVDAADWFSGVKDSVFLTVGAKGPSVTPKVEVASGSIRDAAGNANSTALTVGAAKEELDPKLTVEVSGDDTGGVPVSDSRITITVTANETLGTNPTIETGAVTETDDVLVVDSLSAQSGLTFLGNNQWEKRLSVSSSGAFVVKVTGRDTANNEGSSGSDDPESDKAIFFEMDDGIPAPVLDPGADGEVSRSDPFINIDWSSEGSEYAGDTHNKVTLTVLTLNGEDVLDRAATTNNRSFILTTSGLDLGDHKIAVNGTDEAGNKLSSNHEVTFTVKARPKTKVELKPGMNLVSLPGTPADTSINSVVTLSQVTAITTYDPVNPDPATGSPWLSATRDDRGMLSGSLTQIDAQHAYWVSTTSFDPISVDIPTQGFANVPPAISLVEGWNLVPVVVVGDSVDTIAADTYFGSTSWVTAYTFDPQAGQWAKVLPNNFHDVEVGKGYWLYVEQAGVLVP